MKSNMNGLSRHCCVLVLLLAIEQEACKCARPKVAGVLEGKMGQVLLQPFIIDSVAVAF